VSASQQAELFFQFLDKETPVEYILRIKVAFLHISKFNL